MNIKRIALTVFISFLIISCATSDNTMKIIFDFNSTSDLSAWKIVNDGVMGGVSNSGFSKNDDGHGVFKGAISTANNGGFASVRMQMLSFKINEFKQLKIKLKGDGKNYQLRIKPDASDYYSYKTEFSTSGSWETVVINLDDLYPSFRGRKLDQPNFNASTIEEISFLIANKKNESFELILEKIEIE